MPRSERRVEYARNFTENLVHIGTFLEDEPRFRQLLESLEVRCERLGGLPGLGRPFAAADRPEAPLAVALQSLQRELGATELRELVVGDYLVLYVVAARRVTVLAVRHQREAGYELADD